MTLDTQCMEIELVCAATENGPEPVFVIKINRRLTIAIVWAYKENTNYAASFLIELC